MSITPEPGWYPDPTDPSARRWWDGGAWTDQTAPLHAMASAHAAVTNAGAVGPTLTAPDLSAVFNNLRGNPALTDGLRQSLTQRQPTSLVGGFAYGAGVLLTLSFIALFGNSSNPWLGVLIGVMLIASGWALAMGLRVVGIPRIGRRVLEFTPVATVSVSLGTYFFAFGFGAATATSSFNNNNLSPSAIWGPLLLASLILFALWALPGVQGRPFLLGASLTTLGLAMATFMGLIIAEGPLRRIGSLSGFGDNYIDVLRDIASGASAISLLFGLALMLAVLVLDALGWKGVATPVLAAGWINIIIGMGFVALNPGAFGALILIVVLIGVVTVGGLGRRRTTLWIGTGLIPVVLIAGIGFATSSSPSPIGITILAGFAGLLVLAAAVAALLWGPQIRDSYQNFSLERAQQVKTARLR